MNDKSQAKILSKEKLETCQMWHMPDVATGQSSNKHAASFNLEVDEIRKQAHAEGLKKGYDEAFGSKEAEMNAKILFLNEMIELFSHPMSVFNEVIEQQIFQVIEVMIQQILKKEFNNDPELIKSIFDAIKNELPIVNEKIKLHLNPEDRETLQSLLSEKELQQIDEFIPVEALHRGEAIMQTEHSSMDATVKGRIEAVMEKMLQNK